MRNSNSLILSVQGADAEQFGRLSQKIFDGRDGSIGRSQDCDWVLAADGVSRLHALVRYLNGMYFIEDRSTNGMLHNGAPLRKADPAALKDGDRLQIDTFEVGVRIEPDSQTATLESAPEATAPNLRAAPAPALAPSDVSEPSLPLSAGEVSVPIGGGVGVDSLIPDAQRRASEGALDPLALFDTSFAVADGNSPAAPGQSWNHSPSLSDRFQPPRPYFQPRPQVLPENWDLTNSQFTPVHTTAALPERSLSTLSEPSRIAIDRPSPEAEMAPPPCPQATDAASSVPSPVPEPSAAIHSASVDAMFRIVIDGMMDVLRARAELKNSFRLPVTIIQRSENNPLKFAATAQEAVDKLLAPPSSAFLSGTAALDDALDDIRHHQMAMMAGVRAAFDSMLSQFDPMRFEQDGDGSARRLAFNARNRPWERYRASFEELSSNTDECFRRLFGDEFARAYEEQLARLKTAPRSPIP